MCRQTTSSYTCRTRSRLSAGANDLLASGAALVRGAQDVLDRLLGAGARQVRRAGPPVEPELAAVLAALEAGHASADAIVSEHGGDPRSVAMALVRLELLGYARADPFGRYARTTLEPPSSD